MSTSSFVSPSARRVRTPKSARSVRSELDPQVVMDHFKSTLASMKSAQATRKSRTLEHKMDLRTQIQLASELIDQREAELIQAIDFGQQLVERINSLAEERDNLKQQIDEQIQYGEFQHAYDALKKANEDLELAVKTLTSERNNAKLELDKLSSEFKSYLESRSDDSKLVRELKATIMDLRADIERYKQREEQTRAELLSPKINRRLNFDEESEERPESVVTPSRRRKTHIQEQQEAIAALNEQIGRLNIELTTLRDAAHRDSVQKQSLIATVNELKKENQRLRLDLEEKKNLHIQNENLAKEIAKEQAHNLLTRRRLDSLVLEMEHGEMMSDSAVFVTPRRMPSIHVQAIDTPPDKIIKGSMFHELESSLESRVKGSSSASKEYDPSKVASVQKLISSLKKASSPVILNQQYETQRDFSKPLRELMRDDRGGLDNSNDGSEDSAETDEIVEKHAEELNVFKDILAKSNTECDSVIKEASEALEADQLEGNHMGAAVMTAIIDSANVRKCINSRSFDSRVKDIMVDRLRLQKKELSTSIAKHEDAIKKLTDDQRGLEERIAKLQDDIGELDKRNQDEQAKHSSEIAELNAKIRLLDSQKAQLEADKQRIKQDNGELLAFWDQTKTECSELKKQVEDRDALAEQLRKEIESMTNDKLEVLRQKEELEAELSSQQQKLKKIKREISLLQLKVTSIDSEKRGLMEQIANLARLPEKEAEKMMALVNAELEAIRQRNDTEWQARVDKVSAENVALISERDALQRRCDELLTRIAELERLLSQEKEELLRYEAKISQLESTMNDIKNQHAEEVASVRDQFQKQIDAKDGVVESLKKQLTDATNTIITVKAELNLQFEQQRSEIHYLSAKLKATETELSAVQAELNAQTEHLDQSARHKQQAVDILESRTKEMEQAMREIKFKHEVETEKLKERHAAEVNQIQSAMQQLITQNAEEISNLTKQLSQEREAAEAQLASSKNVQAVLESELKSSRDACAAYKNQIEQLRAALELANQEKQNYRLEVERLTLKYEKQFQAVQDEKKQVEGEYFQKLQERAAQEKWKLQQLENEKLKLQEDKTQLEEKFRKTQQEISQEKLAFLKKMQQLAVDREKQKNDDRLRMLIENSFTKEEVEVFVGWIGHKLSQDSSLKKRFSLPFDGMMKYFDAVRDGVLICKLINACIPGSLDERVCNMGEALSDDEMVENHNLALNSAKASGLSVGTLTPLDIMEGKPHLIMQLTCGLFRAGIFNQINISDQPELVRLLKDKEDATVLSKLRKEQILLRWVNYVLQQSNHPSIQNFTEDVKDCAAYAVLLSRLSADEERLKQVLAEQDFAKRADMVLEWAEQLGCHFVSSTTHNNNNNSSSSSSSSRTSPSPAAIAISQGSRRVNELFVAHLFLAKNALEPLDEEKKAEMERMIISVEVDGTREERVFRNWINSYLTEPITHFSELSDGLILLKVIDKICGGKVDWKRVNLKPGNDFKKLENCNYAVRCVKELMGVALVNIAGKDIFDGNTKLLLGMLWQIMRFNMFLMLGNLTDQPDITEQDIINFANDKVSSVGKQNRITSFKDPSLSTSAFLLDLLYAVSPKSVNYSLVLEGNDDAERESNAKYTISIARKLGAPIFCLWEDICEVQPRMMLTLVGSILSIANNNGQQKTSIPASSSLSPTLSAAPSPSPICTPRGSVLRRLSSASSMGIGSSSIGSSSSSSAAAAASGVGSSSSAGGIPAGGLSLASKFQAAGLASGPSGIVGAELTSTPRGMSLLKNFAASNLSTPRTNPHLQHLSTGVMSSPRVTIGLSAAAAAPISPSASSGSTAPTSISSPTSSRSFQH